MRFLDLIGFFFNILPGLFVLAILTFLVSAFFFNRFKRIFYISLFFIASMLYFWALVNVIAEPMGFRISSCSRTLYAPYNLFFQILGTEFYNPFFKILRMTFYFMVFYSSIALCVCMVRRFLKLSIRKLLLISLTGVVIGLIGIVTFKLVPCEFSPFGCCESPSIMLPVKSTNSNL